jgi:hypothetical protein
VILGLITGVKYVPNLIFFFATNHIGLIDDAFRRSINNKIIFGKPSYEGRKEWIRRKKSVIFQDEATEDAVVAMTINFSHDAMKQFLKTLKYNLYYEGKSNSKVDLEYAKKFILGICSSERIIFGKYLLPNLISSEHLVDIAKIDLTKSQEAFTGRIMVDFDSYLQIEVLTLNEKAGGELGDALTNFINKDTLMNYKDLVNLLKLGVELNSYNIQDFAQRMYTGLKDQDIIYECQQMLKSKLHEKYFSDTKIKSKNMEVSKISKENVLSSLIEFGRINKFHVVYYVDSQTFHKENKFSQQDQQKYIQAIHEECEKYASSMIIYDLDAIVEISKSYSNMKNQIGNSLGGISAPNFSYHIEKQNILSMILDKFKSTSASKMKKTWMVLLVKHPYLKKMVKDSGFEVTEEENQNLMK